MYVVFICMGAHGGCMSGARRGGGGMGAPNIFVGRGKTKKNTHNKKKDPPHREKK